MFPLFDDSFSPYLSNEYRPSELFEISAMGKNNFGRLGAIKKSKNVNKNMLIRENKYRYTARFENVEVKAHVLNKDEKEKEKTLLASIEPLTEFIPKIDYEKNFDLLGVSFNLYTPGKGNKNFQAIGGRDGIELAKTFIGKFINLDHQRKGSICGAITNVGFTTFGDNQPISEDDAYNLADNGEVFNVCVGGIIWRIVDEDLADLIENASDPDSLDYMSISSSWEVSFSDYKIAMGSDLIANCKIIDDQDLISEMKDSLTVFGGKGQTKDGRPLYLLISGESLGLGCAMTKNPAGAVKGVATLETIQVPESVNEDTTIDSDMNKEKIAATIDQPEGIEPARFSVTEIGKVNAYAEEYGKTSDEYCAQLIVFLLAGDDFETATAKTNDYFNKVGGVVTESSQFVAPLEQNEDIIAEIIDNDKNPKTKSVNKNIHNLKYMKLTKIEDLTTEMLTEINASEIKEVVANHLQEAAKSFTDKIAETEQAEIKAKADLKVATDEISELKEKLAKIETAQNEAKAESDFQARMGFLNEEFDLSDEARASILDDVKGCGDDEAFKKFVSKLSVFAAKKKKVADKVEEKVDDKKMEKEVDASEILASLKSDEPTLPNKEIVAESTDELFKRVLGSAIKMGTSKK